MSTAADYKKIIKSYENNAKKWTAQSNAIQRRYKGQTDEQRRIETFRYNILWSNVQTLQPALYAKNPTPNVSRRFDDKDPVGRVAADVLERCLKYIVSCDNYGQVIRQCVIDYLLSGRGTPWVRYVPHITVVEGETLETPAAKDDGESLTGTAPDSVAIETPETPKEPDEHLAYEEAVVDYVYWDDFGCSNARTWDEVHQVWRRVYLTRAELIKRFGEDVGNNIPLDHKRPAEASDNTNGMADNANDKAVIYELWCKTTKMVYWINTSYEGILEERKDPLLLKDFFPCPRPLLANVINNSVLPVPDYVEYQDQALQLDDFTNRIGLLSQAIKVAGVYDASAQGIQQILADGASNVLIPVDQYALLAEKGGIKGIIDFMPMEEIANTLLILYDARERVKNDLYEITGLADILRGASNAIETATAQQLKGQFATLRLSERQSEIQRFARDVLRLLGEIISTKFNVETLKKISGVQLLTEPEKQQALMIKQMQPDQTLGDIEDYLEEPTWDEVIALLRDEPAMMFRIDIETDSTIKADQQQEQADRIEFLAAVGSFLKQGAEAAATAPELVPLMGKMLMFGVRGFKIGKDLEASIEEFVNKAEDNFKAQQGQPKPDPEMAKVQAQQQIEMQKMQNQLMLETEKAKISMELERDKQAAQNADNQREQQLTAAREQQKMQNELQLEQFKAQNELELEKMRIEAETQRALAVERIKSDTAILVAQIGAQQKMQSEQMATERTLIDAASQPMVEDVD
jgi:hypothetical protein